jgi:hypothetical protein
MALHHSIFAQGLSNALFKKFQEMLFAEFVWPIGQDNYSLLFTAVASHNKTF